ncbi:acyltransferase family protein [Prosthecobacter sp.]|uniref:acyltransferase family protein n=1 Tax=Prosthecobacter sp. TaxID=1965333 RepID=UPI0037837C76
MSSIATFPTAAETCTPDTVDVPVKAALTSRLPSLDGWRAISILAVLGSHTKDVAGFPMENMTFFQHAFDGHLGVRFFFVISGFLITWLMLMEEKKDGSVSLKRFYLRRAVRILPVYLVFLAVLAALQFFTPFHQSLAGWLGNLTFTTNYLHTTHASDHLWSLAVEEQFYLLWPVAFVFFKPQLNLKKCFTIVAVMLIAAISGRFILAHTPDSSRLLQRVFHQWSFFNNADSLALGCLSAILLARGPRRFIATLQNAVAPVMLTGAGLIALPIALHYLPLPGALQSASWFVEVCCGRSIQSAGFALLMLQSVLLSNTGFYKLLNFRPLAQIGVLSYSLYIWQQLFCTHPDAFGLQHVWWMSHTFWLLPVIAAACLSYYGLERPLLQLRHRFR